MQYFVFTDGSCKGNPGKGGWGWVEFPYNPDASKACESSVAQRNELSVAQRNELNESSEQSDAHIVFSDCGGEKNTTNNKMEIQAVIEYLEGIVDINSSPPNSYIIHSDSQYVIKSLIGSNDLCEEIKVAKPLLIFNKSTPSIKYSGWLEGWKNKNFEGVKNKEMWLRLDALIKKCIIDKKVRLIFKYVKGHSISVGNNFADRLANEGVEKII